MGDELVKTFSTGGPTAGWVLAAIFLLAIVVLWKVNSGCQKQLVDQRAEFEKTLVELFNARLAEMKVATTTAERVLQVLESFKAAVESRNAAFDRVGSLLEKMATSQEASRERFKEQADRLERGIGDNNQLVHELLKVTRDLMGIVRPRPRGAPTAANNGDGDRE